MRFLIIRLSSLGDIILTQPLLVELTLRYPGCEISYVCKPEYSSLVALMSPAVTILPFREEAGFFRDLRRTPYDAVIDLHGKLASTLILLGANTKKRIIYNKKRRLRQAIVAHKTEASISSTVQLYYSALNKLAGKELNPIRHPRLQVPQIDLPEQNEPRRNHGERLIAIFPGAAHPTKMYPEYLWQSFFELAEPGWRYVMLGSRSEFSIAERLKRSLPDRIENRCGEYNFPELAKVISMCDLVISPDSGPMHLAAALELPQIAIFGSTHPRLGFGPLNPNARVLCADLDCQPCTLHGQLSCPLEHFNCMKQIGPRLLKDSVAKILG